MLIDYRTSLLDDADGSLADGIDRDVAIEVGGQVDYLTSRGIFSASIVGDVSGVHDGAEATLAYSLLMPLGAWTFQPSLGVQYRSQGLGTYLYGIEADDGRAPFRVNDHLLPFASLTTAVDLSEHWSVIAALSVSACQIRYMTELAEVTRLNASEITDLEIDGRRLYLIGPLNRKTFGQVRAAFKSTSPKSTRSC